VTGGGARCPIPFRHPSGASRNHSFLEGASHPEPSSSSRAVELGLRTAGADRSRRPLRGGPCARRRARRSSTCTSSSAAQVTSTRAPRRAARRDRLGYGNLCRLLSKGRLRTRRARARSLATRSPSTHEGLHALWDGAESGSCARRMARCVRAGVVLRGLLHAFVTHATAAPPRSPGTPPARTRRPLGLPSSPAPRCSTTARAPRPAGRADLHPARRDARPPRRVHQAQRRARCSLASRRFEALFPTIPRGRTHAEIARATAPSRSPSCATATHPSAARRHDLARSGCAS
jgi:hypothetical protein